MGRKGGESSSYVVKDGLQGSDRWTETRNKEVRQAKDLEEGEMEQACRFDSSIWWGRAFLAAMVENVC